MSLLPGSPSGPGAAERTRLHVVLRLIAFYLAAFAVLGVYMPYWPVWLKSRGLGSDDVAWVMSGQILARTIAGPLWSQHVDHCGRPARVLLILSWLSLAAIVPFAFADSYTGLLLSSIAFGLVYPPIHPILDNLTVGHAAAQGFGFGRLRMWGSMAFLAINVGTGFLLQRTAAGTSLVLWLVAGGLLSTAFTAHALPELPRPPAHRDGKAITALLAQGRFLLFLVTVGCLQGSHGGYYTFATLHWLASGISKEVAGLLWAEGVLAEIFTFATMALFVRRFRPSTLLLFSALAGAIRWTVLAETVSLPLLFAVNWLHAASFALAYLGAVQHIARVIPGRQGATAQGLMGAATSGVFTCLCTRLAGPLYERAQGGMFLAMAAVAACGGVLALLLRRVEGRS